MPAARKRRPRRLKRQCHACRRRTAWAGGHRFGPEAGVFICAACWAEIERPALRERERLARAASEALERFVLLQCYRLLERHDRGTT
ncbi:MAG: hypothetical protein K2Y37_14730 [Pirellulales bacterium]|nr:hypothetical protein [Pirellulales bacterium]